MAQHIKDLVHTIFSAQQASWKSRLFRQWDTIVGKINTHVRLEKIYNDTLILSVEDASWMHELTCLAPVLINTINKTLDKPRIKTLRFRQKGQTCNRSHPTCNNTTHYDKPTKVHLDKKELYALDTIKDDQLQEALKKFLIRCKKE